LALSPNIRGSLLMAVSMAVFTVVDTITKAVSSEMNIGQVMLVRGLFAVLLVAAFAYQQGALRPLHTLMLRPVALRVLGEIGGTISFMPLAITLGAAVIFREPVGWRRWSAIAAGFIGVLIIVRPGLAGFSQYSLFALVSVAFCALRDLATRKIPAKIPSLFITLLTAVTVTTAGGVILVPLGGWTPPSTGALGLMALAAVLLLIGYQCIISALRTGDISAVAPFRYSALLWAMLLGYIVFGDVPDAMMVTGAAIIVASGLYAFYRERIRHRALAAESSGFPPDGL
jgi:drug/metabolite transporter (DMT)-like permease